MHVISQHGPMLSGLASSGSESGEELRQAESVATGRPISGSLARKVEVRTWAPCAGLMVAAACFHFLSSAWRNTGASRSLHGTDVPEKMDFHSINETVGGLPIHSYWFPLSPDDGCRAVANTSIVQAAFPQADETRMQSHIPACVAKAFSMFKPEKMIASMRRAKEVLGVDALFVVHYPKLAERRLELEKQFVSAGMSGAAVWVDWADLQDKIASSRSVCCLFDCQCRWYQDFASPATRDCSLRHLYVYYEMERQGLQKVIVMEDDVDLHSNASSIRAVVQRAPQNFTAVMLSGTRDWHACVSNVTSGQPSTHLVGPGFGAKTASGYLLSSLGAKALLHNIYGKGAGVNLPADLIMDGAINGGCYWAEPALWTQTKGGGAGDAKSSSRLTEK